ncbi:DUF4870 domain-containing protein [Flavobacterium zepuense]|uniref:DUF4870 domain-containing protein n=1 Tax=Flavobacterium zepuense TaxID=2593302 RepID=A0A552UYD4_9FLAO|nr:DUF4870 domain-containing protein [Flavobacterium zepuense]TRW23244.1 DUF4870 domain-containing protein [Flavobacterium zepuense]
METTAHKTTSTLLQLSALTQYFIPFGNFIFPVIIWSSKKHESEFIDFNGKQAINFQLSLFMYTILLAIIAVPIFLYTFFKDLDFTQVNDCEWVFNEFNDGKVTSLAIIGFIAAFVLGVMKVAEFFLIIYAAVKNSNGIKSNYPLTINFIK